MKFTWKDSNYRVPVEIVVAHVQAIEKEAGVCHPHALVEAARPIGSPLHGLFEWDDSKAAEAYRTDQARGVLQSIRIVFEKGGASVPAFVHVTLEEQGNGYAGIVRAMSDTGMKAQVLADALRQLEALQARYATLSELRPVWEAVKKAKTRRQREPVPVS